MTHPRPIAFLRRRPRRCLAGALALSVAAYAGVYAAVATAQSPSDQTAAAPDGRAVAYLRAGPVDADRRVILLHGAPADASSWRRLLEIAPAALPDVEFIAVDRLGYGASDPATETSLEAHARSLEPLLTPGCVLVGHSYGGPVALRAAADYPDRVGAIVLVAGATDPTMNDAETLRALLDLVPRAVPPSWAAANRELLALTGENDIMQAALDRVRCRVVAVHGEWDPVCPHDGTLTHLETALPNAASVETISIARAGHNLHLSRTEEVLAAIASAFEVSGSPATAR